MYKNSDEILKQVRAALTKPLPDAIAKAWTQSASATSGITFYDLEAEAKNLYPITTILRNMIPRRVGGAGIQANWRSITAVNPSGQLLGVAEGTRGALMDQTEKDNYAKFAFFGLENSVTWEADYAAEGFEDIKAMAVTQLMQATMEAEEKVILGGNATTAIGNAGTVTVTIAAGGTVPIASNLLTCVALTYQGYSTASIANGVVVPFTRTNADGSTTAITGGYSAPSANSAATTTSGNQTVNGSVAGVSGAFGYAWYLGVAGSQVLAAITSGPTVSITAPPVGTQNLTALGASNVSTNPLVFDGLFAQAYNNGGYLKTLNATLTSTGAGTGGIVEFDNAIISFFNNYRFVPTHIFVSGADQVNVRSKILNGNTNVPPFTIDSNGKVIGGAGAWRAYRNPVGFGTETLEIIVHPFLPQGSVLFYTDKVPYALSNVSDIVRMNLRRDYQAITWPLITRKWQYGVYFDGVLQHYFPTGLGIINGIVSG